MPNNKKYIDVDAIDYSLAIDENGRLLAYVSSLEISRMPAANVVEAVCCNGCKYDNACVLQMFVEGNSKDEIPFDRSTWYCPDAVRKEVST